MRETSSFVDVNGVGCAFMHSRLPCLWGGLDSNSWESVVLWVRNRSVVDQYAVAVKKESDITVGHFPRKFHHEVLTRLISCDEQIVMQ